MNYYKKKNLEKPDNIPLRVEPTYTNMRGEENTDEESGFDGDYASMPVMREPNDSASAIISCICGLVSVLICFLPFIPLITGLVAMFTAREARKSARMNDMPPPGTAIAGKVCGFVGIVLSLLISFFFYIVPMIFVDAASALKIF